MGKVSAKTIQNVSKFFDSLPEEVKDKCALCNETLVHIVKTAEARTGAGTATVTRMLSERINANAVPADIVSGSQLRDRVRMKEGKKLIWDNIPNSDLSKVQYSYSDTTSNSHNDQYGDFRVG